MNRLVFIICINSALGKVLTTQAYPVQQYIHVTGVPSYRSDPPPRPPSQPALVPAPPPKQKPEINPKPSPTSLTNPLKKDTPALDSNVLNNLAIALQLLIVSNILNLPPQEGNSEIASKMAIALEPSLEAPYTPSYIIESPKYEMAPKYSVESMMSPYMEPISPPNINYLASSGIGDANIYGPFTPTAKPLPRAEMGFMSPYDAMATSSSYSDPNRSSSYRSVSSKRDFQSPYAAIMSDNKDTFSMFDFY